MNAERRGATRVPVGFYVNEIIEERLRSSFATNLSASGLFLERTFESDRETPSREVHRGDVQLEIPLPGTTESLWVRGEVVYDSCGSVFHGRAVRFVAMARAHRQFLRGWLEDVASEVQEVVSTSVGVSIVRPPRYAGPRTHRYSATLPVSLAATGHEAA